MPDSSPWWKRIFTGSAVSPTTDPRRRQTGTSYSTSGSIDPAPGVYVESGSSRGGLVRDVVPILGNRAQATAVYEEMANSDAAVDVSLRAAKMPVMGADYYVQAFDESPEAEEIANFVRFNLLEGTNAPFLLVLEDILRMFEHGFSIIEKVYEEREWAQPKSGANRRKYVMLRKLAARPTPTIKEIKYDDNGGPVEIIQNAVQGDGKPKEVTFGIEKAIIFTNSKKGGNLEGKSLLRTAYRPWYFKGNLNNIDGIQKERHGMGFPIIEMPTGSKDSEILAARELIRNIRTNEFGGAAIRPGWKVYFAELPGQPVDVLRSVEHHNAQIMLNTMTQFLLLGIEGSGGGRATSGSHQDMFTKSMRYVGNMICDTINLYCVPYLVGYNFQSDKFPKLKVRNIGETKDLQQWASAIANLIKQNAITPDIELEQWVRDVLDAPLKKGGVQTPIKTSGQKGDVTDQNDGNQGAATDNAEG